MISFAVMIAVGFATRRFWPVLLAVLIFAALSIVLGSTGRYGLGGGLAAALIAAVPNLILGLVGIGIGFLVNGRRKFGQRRDAPGKLLDLDASASEL